MARPAVTVAMIVVRIGIAFLFWLNVISAYEGN